MRPAALVMILLAGCDPDDSKPAVDAPTQTPDAAVDASPDAPPAVREGWVVIIEQSDGQAVESDVDVLFADRSPYGGTIASDGPCTAYEDPPMETLSAGMITVTGTTATVSAAITGTPPDVSYSATPQQTPDNLFDTGAVINVQAAGGPDVPAFSGSVTAPAGIAGVVAPMTVSRTTGTTFTWTAGAGPEVWIYMLGITQQHLRFVVCRVNDTGSYMLTPSNIALIPSTSTTNEMIGLGIGRNALTQVTIPGGKVDIFAMSAVLGEVTFTP